jgi:hypothetical protein
LLTPYIAAFMRGIECTRRDLDSLGAYHKGARWLD